MDIYKDSHQVSRLEVVDTGRRRRWTDAEKLRIVEESFSGPRQASATARRHGLSRTLLFSWRKTYRAGQLQPSPGVASLVGGAGESDVGGFVPAVVVPEVGAPAAPATTGGRMEIVSANGRRVIVERDVDVEALLRIVRGLESLR